ncbi:uncharacterized protein GMORB2_2907 [Geosmithia morbida]|uniref:Uncharacterized protein n=1 Tax=Geosmithia morbida TaxID=1094350 RepID=A0A9P5D3F8_9HYPO|nr:uncharacterized protein GMORB2_2907 [Geosmithia morbida]KAF4120469.1 uncharacterized protein GMORB2_2907 [Geosmithia morbida]
MDWLGYAKIDFTHAPAPRPIRSKDGTQTDLLKIVEQATPPCQLNPLLFNGHLQTMWTATKPHGPSVYYRRRLFEAEDPAYEGSFAVDFAVPPHDEVDETLSRRTVYFTDEQWAGLPSDDSKPMLVVLHGLSGGSHEIYLRHCIAPLMGEGGWEVCVVNARGCAKSRFSSGVLYNARATWDARQYCGEEGSDCLLKAAVVCSNPFNLEVSSKMMQSRYFSREVYLRVMGTGMKKLIASHREDLEKHETRLDFDALEKVTYLHEFDRLIQVPCWGYPTEYAYYRDASSSDAITSIRIPFLAISATDDPIAVKEAIPFEEFEQNPNTVLLTTSLGGHLCWFEYGGTRWYTRPVDNFLNHMAFETDLAGLDPSEEPTVSGNEARRTQFDPMRRKMAMSGTS